MEPDVTPPNKITLKSMITARKIVFTVIEFIDGQPGLWHSWNDLNDEAKRQIRVDLIRLIVKHL